MAASRLTPYASRTVSAVRKNELTDSVNVLSSECDLRQGGGSAASPLQITDARHGSGRGSREADGTPGSVPNLTFLYNDTGYSY